MALPTALVVEDDAMVRETLVQMLRRLGFRTVEACDARSAMKKLDTIETLDLVLSDVVMPGGIYGWDLARIIRQLRPAARVLLITGYAEGSRRVDAALRAEEVLLPKPITCAQLGDAIADAFEIPASA